MALAGPADRAWAQSAFSLTFPTTAPASQFGAVYGSKVATRYPFGTQRNPGDKWPDGTPVTPAQAASSRTTGPNTLNVDVDAGFLADALTPRAQNGYLFEYAMPTPKADLAKVGGRTWESSVVSTAPTYRLPAHWEIDATFYATPMAGAWDTIDTYTDAGGQNGEVTCFELYGGVIPTVSQGKPYNIDLRNKPFTSMHAKPGAPLATNQQTMKALAPGWHHMKCRMTAASFTVSFDGVQTFRAPPQGLDTPGRYIVVTRDVDPRQQPSLGQAPSPLILQSLTVDSLP